MALAAEKKKELVSKFQKDKNDSGSSEVQIAILTEQINSLTKHLSQNPKDFSSQRGLLMMVGKRKRLLKYLNRKNKESYRRTIDQLSIRG